MRIGIMSDSHGNDEAVAMAVQQAGTVDLWLHAGDGCADAEYLETLAAVPVVKVAGNCDWPSTEKTERIVELGAHNIWLTHGHLYGVQRGVEQLAREAAGRGCDIVVYGHTHIARQIRSGDILVLNPGSIGRPKSGGPSFMVLQLDDAGVSVELIEVTP